MTFELFLNFNGSARQAAEFYAQIFNSEVKNLMTFGESPAPTDPNIPPIKDSEKDRIMYAEVKIGDKNIMFMDDSEDFPITIGDNITPTLNLDSTSEVDRIFTALSTNGKVIMSPAQTFFSPYYSMLTDQFGITWHIMLAENLA